MQPSTSQQNNPVGYTADQILAAALDRGCLEPLSGMLKNGEVDPTNADNLYRQLQRIGIDFSAAFIALKDTRKRHCLRCHTTYMECYNGPEECTLNLSTYRKADDLATRLGGVTLDESTRKTNTVEVGYWHTDDPEDLQFPWLMNQCEKRGCIKI